MEEFQAVLERVFIALKDCGPGKELQGQNLNLTVKEKLFREDVLAYKHWLMDHSLEDSFELLMEWVRRRLVGLRRENMMHQKDEEAEIEATEFMAEVLVLDPNQEAAL